MARVLLAWELGGNRGHVAKLGAVAASLIERGHSVGFAVQRPDSLRDVRALAETSEIRQAPIWPGLLAHAGLPRGGAAAAYGDVLAALGMADSGVLEYLLRAWDRLIADAKPDVVVGDFAPAALIAARGRVPTVALGTGFCVPPSQLPSFPVFHPEATKPNYDEAALLGVVNHALRRTGRAALDRLPAIAAADRECPAVFCELDPYAAHRVSAPLPPFLSGAPGVVGEERGIFAYVPRARAGRVMLSDALANLAARGIAIAAHLPGLDPADGARLVAAGVRLHERPVPPAAIAAQSALLVTTGGIGLMSAALAAGLPMALLPTDIEKRLNAEAAARRGVARVLDAAAESSIAAWLEASLNDATLTARARSLAPGFAARLGDSAASVADEIATLT